MEKTTIVIWKVTPATGHIEQLAISPESLNAATQQLPQGGYTTFRTFQHSKVLRLDEHFERLESTARLMGFPMQIDRQQVLAALRQAIGQYPNGGSADSDLRVRISLDLTGEIGAVYLLLEALHLPAPQAYETGVRAVTRTLQRDNPKAKYTAFVETAAQVRSTLPAGINEALMISADGQMLEGLSSNFFAVWNGRIWTAEEGVLSGITRSVVLDAIRSLGFPLQLEGLAHSDLDQAQETFITSATRAVLPVTEIDGRPVADGRPGPITRQLLREYLARIEKELDEI